MDVPRVPLSLAFSTLSSIEDSLRVSWQPTRDDRILAARLLPCLDAPPYRIHQLLNDMIGRLGHGLGEGHGLRMVVAALSAGLENYLERYVDIPEQRLMAPEHRELLQAGREVLNRVVGDVSGNGALPPDIAAEVFEGRRIDVHGRLVALQGELFYLPSGYTRSWLGIELRDLQAECDDLDDMHVQAMQQGLDDEAPNI